MDLRAAEDQRLAIVPLDELLYRIRQAAAQGLRMGERWVTDKEIATGMGWSGRHWRRICRANPDLVDYASTAPEARKAKPGQRPHTPRRRWAPWKVDAWMHEHPGVARRRRPALSPPAPANPRPAPKARWCDWCGRDLPRLHPPDDPYCDDACSLEAAQDSRQEPGVAPGKRRRA